MITIKTVTPRGHEVTTLEPEAALSFVRNAANTEGKWLFLNGRITTNVNDLMLNDLIEAEDVTLSNALAGG